MASNQFSKFSETNCVGNIIFFKLLKFQETFYGLTDWSWCLLNSQKSNHSKGLSRNSVYTACEKMHPFICSSHFSWTWSFRIREPTKFQHLCPTHQTRTGTQLWPVFILFASIPFSPFGGNTILAPFKWLGCFCPNKRCTSHLAWSHFIRATLFFLCTRHFLAEMHLLLHLIVKNENCVSRDTQQKSTGRLLFSNPNNTTAWSEWEAD